MVKKVSALESELACLLIESLDLQGVAAEDIDPDAPLFGDGLGLDSLDALELATVVSKTYGVQLRSDDANNQHIFESLRSLGEHIERRRTR